MSCDYFEPDNFPTPPRSAKARFGTARQCASHPDISLATPEAVASFLRGVNPGASGLTVFRTHFTSVGGDPTASGFELEGGTLEVGWLLPRDPLAGRTILGMTSRVLLPAARPQRPRSATVGSLSAWLPHAYVRELA